MSIERLSENLRNATYKFAKTMPYIPHYYTVGKTWDNYKEFLWTCHAIQEHGVKQQFFNDPRKYFYLDGWRYWIMDKDPNDAAIINRERETIRKPKWSE